MTSLHNDRDKVEEIKNRLDIVDVIRRDIILNHRGDGEYVGSVPPVGESGESLKVNRRLQIWNDMKNGRGGDVLDWIGYNAGYGDPRGTDFPEVLRIAADLAGVELEDITDQERETAKEKADVHNLFTEAVEIYHNNLKAKPELYDFIKEKWGITQDTVDLFKIGYATTGRDLKDLDKATLKKSGLVYVNEKILGEVFAGRITFPYWKNGKVVYLIGRSTEETPKKKDGSVVPKYQKLLVYKEGHEYVSPSVQNSYFYGEDSLRGADYCIITEGVTDCIAMLQACFPCISPVTVKFRDKDHPKLISLTKGLKRVYICNDNEANEAGLKGALSTAEALESEGIETRIIQLPKPEGIDKIDIADYMKGSNKEDFEGLMDSSKRLWEYKLNQQEVPASSTSLERLRMFKTFISNDLSLMQSDEWEVFVNNEVCKKFKLNKTDIKNTVAEVAKGRSQVATGDEGEARQDEPAGDSLSGYSDDIIKRANDILNTGDSFKFILDIWNRFHVGDKNIGENLLCSIAGTQIINAELGGHIKPSGASGMGKSSAFRGMLILLPRHKYITGSMSSKALFYDPNLVAGVITYSDDAEFNPDVVAMMKQATSHFQDPTIHRTVNADRKYEEHVIPPRITFWLSSVESIPDEQLATRFFFGDVDESKDQNKQVSINQKKRMLEYKDVNEDKDVSTCRCIFDMIFKNTYAVAAPYIFAVTWNDEEHRRNQPKFLDLLSAVAVYNYRQRETIHGMLVSTIADYERAIEIYSGTAKSNALCLNDGEQKILWALSSGKEMTSKELYQSAKENGYNKSEKTMKRTIGGIKDNGGMLRKIPGIEEWKDRETTEVSDESGTKHVSRGVQKYQYNGDIFKQVPGDGNVKFECILFQTVASIDSVKAEHLIKEWKEGGKSPSDSPEDTEDTGRHQKTQENVSCTNDDSRPIINNEYIKKEIRRQDIEECMKEENMCEKTSLAVVEKYIENTCYLTGPEFVSSEEIDEISGQPMTKSRRYDLCPPMSSDVFTISELKNYGVVSVEEAARILEEDFGDKVVTDNSLKIVCTAVEEDA